MDYLGSLLWSGVFVVFGLWMVVWWDQWQKKRKATKALSRILEDDQSSSSSASLKQAYTLAVDAPKVAEWYNDFLKENIVEDENLKEVLVKKSSYSYDELKLPTSSYKYYSSSYGGDVEVERQTQSIRLKGADEAAEMWNIVVSPLDKTKTVVVLTGADPRLSKYFQKLLREFESYWYTDIERSSTQSSSYTLQTGINVDKIQLLHAMNRYFDMGELRDCLINHLFLKSIGFCQSF